MVQFTSLKKFQLFFNQNLFKFFKIPLWLEKVYTKIIRYTISFYKRSFIINVEVSV